MVPDNIADFSFSSWYHKFRSITFPSIVISLPDDFVGYLKEDGLHLPDGVDDTVHGDETWTPFSHDSSGFSDSEEEVDYRPWVVDLRKKVDLAIMELGGNVFPKLNWSSPKDAKWISPNRQLKCSNLAEILTLLKASTFINYDLSDKVQQHGPVRIELVLRTWMELNPGWEFRCFVKEGILIGISQRYTGSYYSFIVLDRSILTAGIKKFFDKKISGVFTASNYVFDIVACGSSWQNFRLVDFNPFHRVTDASLFNWDELETAVNIPDDQLLRFVSSPGTVRADEMRQYEIPIDIANPDFTTGSTDLLAFMNGRLDDQDTSDEEILN